MATKSLEGKLGWGQALFKVLLPAFSFVGSIFLARYINLAFDRIHDAQSRELPGEKTRMEEAKRRTVK